MQSAVFSMIRLVVKELGVFGAIMHAEIGLVKTKQPVRTVPMDGDASGIIMHAQP